MERSVREAVRHLVECYDRGVRYTKLLVSKEVLDDVGAAGIEVPGFRVHGLEVLPAAPGQRTHLRVV